MVKQWNTAAAAAKSLSRVRLLATPWTAAHQAPPSLGFSRQEHWSGCHRLLQRMKVKSESEVAQSGPTLSDPMDCSPPGSSVHGIFQARVLQWVPSPSPMEYYSAIKENEVLPLATTWMDLEGIKVK